MLDGTAWARSVLLAVGVVVLYRWFTKLDDEGDARLSEGHAEHEEDAAELPQMVKRAERIAGGYAKRGDPERALEWNFRAWNSRWGLDARVVGAAPGSEVAAPDWRQRFTRSGVCAGGRGGFGRNRSSARATSLLTVILLCAASAPATEP